MPERFTSRVPPGQAFTLVAASTPRRLVVLSGRLWLTITGCGEDCWLSAGEGMTLAPGQVAVVEAWPEAAFQLLQPAPRRAPLVKPQPRGRMKLVGA